MRWNLWMVFKLAGCSLECSSTKYFSFHQIFPVRNFTCRSLIASRRKCSCCNINFHFSIQRSEKIPSFIIRLFFISWWGIFLSSGENLQIKSENLICDNKFLLFKIVSSRSLNFHLKSSENLFERKCETENVYARTLIEVLKLFQAISRKQTIIDTKRLSFKCNRINVEEPWAIFQRFKDQKTPWRLQFSFRFSKAFEEL